MALVISGHRDEDLVERVERSEAERRRTDRTTGAADSLESGEGGQRAAHLPQDGMAELVPSTVQRFVRRMGLRTRGERLAVHEEYSWTPGVLAARKRPGAPVGQKCLH